MIKDKDYNAIIECYSELFANSTPQADFISLIDNAPTNEYGQKEIDFMNYEIDESIYNKILDAVIKKYKYSGYKKQMFKNTIYLGCSPKFKKI